MLSLKNKIYMLSVFTLLAITQEAYADGNTLSAMAQHIAQQMNAIVSLLSITAYVSGVGFAMTGILQFKTHKENPQQTPLSKPVVMLIVAALSPPFEN